ncbi:MAG TPA: NAD(P)-dependent oxidoreductase [Nevskiaceae bacterium]
MKIAFLGTGNMGLPMAKNLLETGHELSAWNRTAARAKPLQDAGARLTLASADAVRGAEVIVTMLSNDAATHEALVDSGALDAAARASIVLDMATVSARLATELTRICEKRGLAYVAAPVLGRPEEAAARRLHIIVAGAPEAVSKVGPLLSALGQKVWPAGDVPSRANVMKIQINLMLSVAIQSLAEAAALGEASGVSTGDFVTLASHTLFACPAYQGYGAAMQAAKYEPAGFSARNGYKDVNLALELARDAPAPLALASVVRDALAELIASGGGNKDWGALAEIARRRAAAPRPTR